MYHQFWKNLLTNSKQSNGHIIANCPVCSEDRGHFYANVHTGLWDCKRCQASGNAWSFLRDHQGWEVKQIAQHFDKYNISRDRHIESKAISKPKTFDIKAIDYYCSRLTDEKLAEFAQERGLSIEILKRYRLGINDAGEFTLPVVDVHGDIRNIIRKKAGGSTISSKDGDGVLFGVDDLLSDAKEIFIVEGPWSAMALKERGYKAVGTCGAGVLKDEQTSLFKDKNVFTFPDNDDPGRSGAQKIARKLKDIAKDIFIVDLPVPEKKDVRDYFKAGGTKDEFEKIVNACPKWHENKNSFPDDSINELKKKYGGLYYLNDKGQVTKVNESFWAGLHLAEHIELFEPDEKCFYRYDPKSGLYEPTSEDIIKQEISERILEVSRQDNQPSLEKKRENTTLNSIVGQLRGIAERRGCFAKKVRAFVHLANGVITLSDEGRFDLDNFSPDFYSRNQSPIVYDPNACCNRFLNELLMPAVNSDDVMLIQKYLGLCLLGDNLIQRFLILDGKEGRGKSTLALIVQSLIGNRNVAQLRTQHLNSRFELYRLLKRTLLVGVDVPGDFLSEKGAQVIKGLVGGDMLDAEQKGGNGNFQLKGNFCVVITSNSRLHVRFDGDMGAWKRRTLIVRFEAPPPSLKISHFNELLIKEEGSGILNWALEGLSLALEDIKAQGDIKMTEKQAGRVDALMAESDSVRHFLREKVERNEGSDLTIQEIIEAYAEYCPVMGWVAKPITTIQRELEGLMLELFRTSKANSIKRNGKDGKGFRYVNFKKSVSNIILEEEE